MNSDMSTENKGYLSCGLVVVKGEEDRSALARHPFHVLLFFPVVVELAGMGVTLFF
jgi:hypothetical protein